MRQHECGSDICSQPLVWHCCVDVDIVNSERLLGIYSGPGVDRYGPDIEDPELPTNLRRKFGPGENWVFADFEVCVLEPEKPGGMQAVCIESVKNIVVEK
jgi:hypothetical protein